MTEFSQTTAEEIAIRSARDAAWAVRETMSALVLSDIAIELSDLKQVRRVSDRADLLWENIRDLCKDII